MTNPSDSGEIFSAGGDAVEAPERPRRESAAAGDDGASAPGGGAPNARRLWVFRLLLTAFSVGFVFFLFEVPMLLGIVDYRLVFRNLGNDPYWSPLNRLDPELLHVHRPHLEYQGVQPGGDITFYHHIEDKTEIPFDVKYDANGFRNPTDIERADIVVLGDSFIEATTVRHEEMLSTRLGALTGRTVANQGQLWYGPQQELAVLRRYALRLQPKVVVWGFFGGNDLSDFRRYEEMQRHWDERSAQFHSVKQRSFTRNLVVLGRRLVAMPPRLPDALFGWFPANAASPKKMYFFYPELPMTPEDRATFPRVVSLLAEAERRTREAGARFVVAYVPTKFQVYQDACRFEPGTEVAKWSSNELRVRLGDAVRKLSPEALYVDLTPDLAVAARDGKLVYFRDDTHWTALGNDVAARTIERALREAAVLK